MKLQELRAILNQIPAEYNDADVLMEYGGGDVKGVLVKGDAGNCILSKEYEGLQISDSVPAVLGRCRRSVLK